MDAICDEFVFLSEDIIAVTSVDFVDIDIYRIPAVGERNRPFGLCSLLLPVVADEHDIMAIRFASKRRPHRPGHSGTSDIIAFSLHLMSTKDYQRCSFKWIIPRHALLNFATSCGSFPFDPYRQMHMLEWPQWGPHLTRGFDTTGEFYECIASDHCYISAVRDGNNSIHLTIRDFRAQQPYAGHATSFQRTLPPLLGHKQGRDVFSHDVYSSLPFTIPWSGMIPHSSRSREEPYFILKVYQLRHSRIACLTMAL